MTDRYSRAGIVSLLVLSTVLLGLAPLAMPPSYSWILHTTSESAAQGIPGAWIARSAFVLLGSAVLWLTFVAQPSWRTWGTVFHSTFGIMMIGAATFSHRPWLPHAPFDRVEDLLHSVAATTMGFAFAGGVAVVGVARRHPSRLDQIADIIAVASSVVMPLAMLQAIQFTGAIQRGMFLVAYAWFVREALRHTGLTPRT